MSHNLCNQLCPRKWASFVVGDVHAGLVIVVKVVSINISHTSGGLWHVTHHVEQACSPTVGENHCH